MIHIEQLRNITRHLTIAHHIPGRIRLKLLRGAFSNREMDALGQVGSLHNMIAIMPGIQALRVNLAAMSCVVEYDTSEIPCALWESLLSGEESEAVHDMLARIEHHYQQHLKG